MGGGVLESPLTGGVIGGLAVFGVLGSPERGGVLGKGGVACLVVFDVALTLGVARPVKVGVGRALGGDCSLI
jgi:hypothetical protein